MSSVIYALWWLIAINVLKQFFENLKKQVIASKNTREYFWLMYTQIYHQMYTNIHMLPCGFFIFREGFCESFYKAYNNVSDGDD